MGILATLKIFSLLWLTVTGDSGVSRLANHAFVRNDREQRQEQHEEDTICVSPNRLSEICNMLSQTTPPTLPSTNTTSFVELNARTRIKRRRHRTEVGVDPFTISVVATGVIWATLYLVEMATKSLTMKWLKDRDRDHRDTIALAVKETCAFVADVYDRLRFQKHAIMSVLQMFAADSEGHRVKLTASLVQTHPEFTSWIEFLRELEYSMLTFYKMFGEDTLCPVFKEPPEFHFISTMFDLFDESVDGDIDDDESDIEGHSEPIRFRPANRLCSPQIIIRWIRREADRFGRTSWDESRRSFCALSDETLMETWNTELRWKCELDDVRQFKIENCFDSFEESLLSESSSTTLEEEEDSSSLEEEEDLSSVSSEESLSEKEEEDLQDQQPGILATLSNVALKAIRNFLRPLGIIADHRQHTVAHPPPHSLTADSCRAFGSGDSERCSEMSSCEWDANILECNPLSSSTSPPSLPPPTSTGTTPPPSRTLSTRSESSTESVLDDESRLRDADDVVDIPTKALYTPMLPSSFSSKVRLVMFGSNNIVDDKMPAGEVEFEDTNYPTDLIRFMTKIGEISYADDDINKAHIAPPASILHSNLYENHARVSGVIRLNTQIPHVETSYSRKWVQMKDMTLSLYPTDIIGLSQENWKPVGTMQLHPHKDTGTAIVQKDVELPAEFREFEDRTDDLRCFEISVKNPEHQKPRRTTLCALSENSRAYWIDGILRAERRGSSPSSSSPSVEREALSKERKSEDRMKAFARLPWAQRTFKGFMTFDCTQKELVTSSSTVSSVCEPVRSKGREPRRAGRLWTPKHECGPGTVSCLPQRKSVPMNSHYYIITTESLAWYENMETDKPINSIPISDLDVDAETWETPTLYSSGESYWCFVFTVNEPGFEIKHKRHVLCAKDEYIANEWFEALLHAYIRCYRRRVQVPVLEDLSTEDALERPGRESSRRTQIPALNPHDPMRIGSSIPFSVDNFREYFPLTDLISVAEDEMSSESSTRRKAGELWTPLCKVGPSRSMNRKRIWTRYSISLNEEYVEFSAPSDWAGKREMYPKEQSSNKPNKFRIKIVDIKSETIDLVSMKALKKTPPSSPEDFVKSAIRYDRRPQRCLIFEVRRPSTNWGTQVLCGSRRDHMPIIQSVMKKTTDRASPQSKAQYTSAISSDEDVLVEKMMELDRQGDRSRSPRWSFSVVSNALSRERFVSLIRDMMTETMPKARLWTWRHVGCPTGCRCPVYVSFYTIQGISTIPDGHVRYVYRDCRRGLGSSRLPPKKQRRKSHEEKESQVMGIELHSIEVYASTSANGIDTVNSATSQRDVVGGEANAQDVAKKNMWPLFELRFVQSTINRFGILPDDDVVDVGSRGEIVQSGLHFCDRSRLSSTLDLLWQFVRRRDGDDLWFRWSEMIPKKIQSVETLLLNPLIDVYRAEVTRHVARESSQFHGFDAFYVNEILRGCNAEEFRIVLENVHLKNRLMEQFFSTDSESGLESLKSSSAEFHADTSDRAEADAVLTVLWNAQNNYGCAPNQIYHSLERKCYAFCHEWGPRVVRNQKCHAVAQAFPGDQTCGSLSKLIHKAQPPSYRACKKLCQHMFGNHPMCLVADPEKMPQVRNDFLRENELGFRKYKYAFWDAPRIALPTLMLVSQVTGHSLFVAGNSNWFVQFLTGTSQVAEGTAMTFVGIGTAVVLSIVNVVNAIIAVVGTYNTVASYKNERAFLDMVLEQQLKAIDYAKCRLMSYVEMSRESMGVPDSEGRTLVGRVMEDFHHLSKRVKVTPKQIKGLVKQICEGPVPFPGTPDSRGDFSKSGSEFCKRMLFQDIPGLVHTVEVGSTDQDRAHRPGNQQEAISLVLGILKSLHLKTSRIHQSVDPTSATASKDKDTCSMMFPPHYLDPKPHAPVSKLYASWLMSKDDDRVDITEWRPWLDRIRRESNGRRYEIVFRQPSQKLKPQERDDLNRAIEIESTGSIENSQELTTALTKHAKIDVKLGLTGNAKLVFLMERDPSKFAMTGLRFLSIPKGKGWSPHAEDTVPTKYEYDQAIIAASKGDQPVELVPLQRSKAECNAHVHRRNQVRLIEDAQQSNDCSKLTKVHKCSQIGDPNEAKCARYCTSTRVGRMRQTRQHFKCRFVAGKGCQTGAKESEANRGVYECDQNVCGTNAKPEAQKQCDRFEERFEGATFLDSVRSGGYVDLNYACQSKSITEGREENIFWASPQMIFLSYATEPGLAPIVDLKFSAEGNSELRENGYYRIRENLNHQCTDSLRPGFMGGIRKSYLWYKQDWDMRFGFREVNAIARKVSAFAEDCIFVKEDEEGWSVNPVDLPDSDLSHDTHGRRWYDTCGICMKTHSVVFGGPENAKLSVQCEVTEDERIECKDNGKTTGYMLKHEALDENTRKQIEWFGHVTYNYKNGCQALGLGKLRTITQVRNEDGDWIDTTDSVRDITSYEVDEEDEEDEDDYTQKWRRPLFTSGPHQVTDYEFVGAVREYSDEALYTYTPEARLSNSPFHIMCQEWQERLNMLQRRRERGMTEVDETDYKRDLLQCLDDGSETVDCASRLLTCVKGFHGSPGLVGGPPLGTLMNALTGHRCRLTARKIGLENFGMTETEASLRVALKGRRCMSSSEALVEEEDLGVSLEKVVTSGWLELQPKTYQKGGLARIRHMFSKNRNYYFVLHSCHGEGKCALEGFRASPTVTPQADRTKCASLYKVSKCRSAPMRRGHEKQDCESFCSKSFLNHYSCKYDEDEGCVAGSSLERDEREKHKCADKCGSESAALEEPEIRIELKDILDVSNELRNIGQDEEYVKGFEIVTYDRSYFLHTFDSPPAPDCVTCLEKNTGAKRGKGMKWCHDPDNMGRNHCEVVGKSCGRGGFKKIKGTDKNKCPPDPVKLLNQAVKWRDDIARTMDEIDAPMIVRPTPDGYGVLTDLKSRDDVNEPLSYERVGMFSRGLQVGIGAMRLKDLEDSSGKPTSIRLRGVEVGYYDLGTMSFGVTVFEKHLMDSSQRKSVYSVCDPFCTYKGFSADMSTENHFVWPQSFSYPTMMGSLSDSQHRVVYWGSFGLWYPYGIGVWFDYDSGVYFRGVVKKEYKNFLDEESSTGLFCDFYQDGHVEVKRKTGNTNGDDDGDEDDGEEENMCTRTYVPVLAGVLSRISDKRIDDSEVLKLTRRDIPKSVTELASMYFNIDLDSTRPNVASVASIHCRSRAVSNYNVFMDKYRSIGSVWLAVSDFTRYAYEGRIDVTGTGTQLDVDLGGLDTSALVRTHALRLTALRRHIENEMEEMEKHVMDEAIRRAIDLLTLAEKLAHPFDPFERYWREMVLEDDDMGGTSELVMRAASRFASLGPGVYLRYQSVRDILDGIDEALKFVSEMYCSLCTSSASMEDLYYTLSSEKDDVHSEGESSKTGSGSTESEEESLVSEEESLVVSDPLLDVLSLSGVDISILDEDVSSLSSTTVEEEEEEDDEFEMMRPEIVVRVLRGRSLYRQGKRDKSVNVYVSVEVAGEVKLTDTATTRSNDPIWDDNSETISELTFDGGDEGLDPNTIVRISVYHRRTIMSDVFIGQWSEKLVNLVHRSAQKPNWYPLGWHLDGRPFNTAPLYGFGDLQLSFNVKGLAMLLAGYHSDLPKTCGLSTAVSGVIEGIQAQLPKIQHLISTHEEKISCSVQSVVSSSFAPAVGCVVPSIERIRPHLISNVEKAKRRKDDDEETTSSSSSSSEDDSGDFQLGPMVFPMEGHLRSDIIGGIYDPDVKGEGSVGTFEEASRRLHDFKRKKGKFYQGYEYFATVLRKLEGLD